MQPINQLVTTEKLQYLATRSHFRFGKDIAENGVVKVTKSNTFNYIASVQRKDGGETRTVELSSTTKGFRWKCTCSSKKDLFCEHAVAVGLFMVSENDRVQSDHDDHDSADPA